MLDERLRIPEGRVGYIISRGNLHYDDSLRVPLSSISQHSKRIGEEAGRIALAILNSKVPPKPETVVLQPELVVRASTTRTFWVDCFIWTPATPASSRLDVF